MLTILYSVTGVVTCTCCGGMVIVTHFVGCMGAHSIAMKYPGYLPDLWQSYYTPFLSYKPQPKGLTGVICIADKKTYKIALGYCFAENLTKSEVPPSFR